MANEYKIAVSWKQKIEGQVVISADSLEKAIESVPEYLSSHAFPNSHRAFWGPKSQCSTSSITNINVDEDATAQLNTEE